MCHLSVICCDQNIEVSTVLRWQIFDFLLYFCVLLYFYRPQRSWAKVIFLQVSVCPHGGRGVCLSACWDTHPQTRHTTPPGADIPQTRHTTPGRQTPSGPGTPPTPPHPPSPPPSPVADPTPPTRHHPQEADCSIRFNEQPVRILLECILVLIYFAQYWYTVMCMCEWGFAMLYGN